MPRLYENVFRFKVTLTHLRPEIWRRIEVPETYSFWDLHVAIQDAMGWWDEGSHLFTIGRLADGDAVRIGGACPEEIDQLRYADTSRSVPVAQFFREPGDRAAYEYACRDGWMHGIALEAIAPRETGVRYPRCVKGARARPPEQCGGPIGYRAILAELPDPEHYVHRWSLEEFGRRFDPLEFDPATVRFDDPHARWWRRVNPPWPRPRGIEYADLVDTIPGVQRGRRKILIPGSDAARSSK